MTRCTDSSLDPAVLAAAMQFDPIDHDQCGKSPDLKTLESVLRTAEPKRRVEETVKVWRGGPGMASRGLVVHGPARRSRPRQGMTVRGAAGQGAAVSGRVRGPEGFGIIEGGRWRAKCRKPN